MRRRQDQLEETIRQNLAGLRIPDDERRAWFRRHLAAMCDDQVRVREEQNRQARKRLTELEQIQQRLLDAYLVGAVEKDAFTARSGEMKIEEGRLQERLGDAKSAGKEVGQCVLEVFDFAQDAAKSWTVSGTEARRTILGRVLLKRSLSATSLVTTKRKPFDVLAERPISEKTRGDWHSFEPSPILVEGYMAAFVGSTPSYLQAVERLAARCA